MNEVNSPDCPVCGKKMSGTANSYLFICKVGRNTYVPEFGESINYYDSAVQLKSDGNYEYQQYVIIPYRITIQGPELYSNSRTGSCVEKIVSLKHDFHTEQLDPYPDWREVFHTPEELNLPWHDAGKCIDKIKRLILFS